MLQISRTWHEKGILFLENAYGGQGPVHSYFLILLFSPLTHYFGAKGLFLGLLLIFFLLSFLIFRQKEIPISWRLLLLSLLLGPYGFWLIDNPTYGFQLELCYAPLAALTLFFLEKNQKIGFYISSILLILVREEGPIVLAGCLLAHNILQSLLNQQKFPYRKAFFQLFICGLLFGLHMTWLYWMAYKNPDHPALTSKRISDGIHNFMLSFQDPYYKGLYVRMLKYLMAFPILSFFVFFKIKEAFKMAFCLLIVLLPFLVINYISSATYFPNIYEFGLTWPYRAAPIIGLFWGIFWYGIKNAEKAPWTKNLAVLTLMLLVVQAFLLYKDRDYSFHQHFFVFLNNSKKAKMQENDYRIAQCLSKNIPSRSPIATSHHLFALFENTDLIWPDRLSFSPIKPQAFICHEVDKKIASCLSSAYKSRFYPLFSPSRELAFFVNKNHIGSYKPIWDKCLSSP